MSIPHVPWWGGGGQRSLTLMSWWEGHYDSSLEETHPAHDRISKQTMEPGDTTAHLKVEREPVMRAVKVITTFQEEELR